MTVRRAEKKPKRAVKRSQIKKVPKRAARRLIKHRIYLYDRHGAYHFYVPICIKRQGDEKETQNVLKDAIHETVRNINRSSKYFWIHGRTKIVLYSLDKLSGKGHPSLRP